jgi:CBS-domain-containing membrane protein
MMECHLLIGCILPLFALILCKAMVMKTYLGKMRGQRIKRARVGWKDAFWSWVGAFTGMAVICWLSSAWLSQQLLIVGSFGATSVLIYAAPESPFAQPSHVLFGSMLSAGIGVACYQLLGATPFPVSLAVSPAVLGRCYRRAPMVVGALPKPPLPIVYTRWAAL